MYHGSKIKLLEKYRDADDPELKQIGVKEELMGELKKWNIDRSVLCKTGGTLMCLSIGTPESNNFSICPKWKIHYFQVSQNLGRSQPHYNLLEYWDT